MAFRQPQFIKWALYPFLLVLALTGLAGCRSITKDPASRPTDAIIVSGRYFPVGTRVVTWLEPGGYNAYEGRPVLVRRRGVPIQDKKFASARRELAALREVVDQFVLHYDGCGLSKVCFNVLRQRNLSVHFLLDVDGTIYQTLDLRERAMHATIANDRSIGIEIAHIGAYAPNDTKLLNEWYERDAAGEVHYRIPVRITNPGILTSGFKGKPARPGLVRGRLQNTDLAQYDFTPEQYEALIRLTAALCQIFPKLKADFPRDEAGRLITRKLPDPELAGYRGLLGHYHLQENKFDPGPAMQWNRLVEGVRQRQQQK
jgi:N-acetyl-anhydromuramyl-L-alanine amidase AmpD